MTSIEMQPIAQQSLEQIRQPLLRPEVGNRSDEALGQRPPKTLKESTSSQVKRLIPHFSILFIPICFIVLGACLSKFNGTAESKRGKAVKQAARVASTLWPIAFAAVVGPMVKAIALYTAERGTQLGTLEVLSASQTLVSTLRSCFSLRIFSIWTILLTMIWTLSPAGGQGVLRAIELRKNVTSSKNAIQYFPVNNLSISGEAFNRGASSKASLINMWKALSGAALSSPDVRLLYSNGSSKGFEDAVERAGGASQAIESTRNDVWNNVRIPFLHLLPGYDVDSPFEWVEVPPDLVPPYESLIGIPVQGVIPHKIGNTTFVIKTLYQHLSCNPWINKTEWLQDPSVQLTLNSVTNGSISWDSSGGNDMDLPNIFLDIKSDTQRIRNSEYGEPSKKQTLVFGLKTMGSVTLCDITTSYVDSKIDCTRPSENDGLSCAAKAVRHTENLPISGNLTAFDIQQASKVLLYIPYIMASSHPGEASLLEKYLEDPPSAFDKTFSVESSWFVDRAMYVFQARLGMIINTCLRASLDMPSLVGTKNITLDDDGWGNTTGTWTRFTEDVYELKRPWFTLYMASTLVLTLCALINIALRGVIRAPDFLGSISALTRDSPFIDAPAEGTAMDGAERTRLLKDKWVRIQNVKPGEKVGRIAFSDAKGECGLDWNMRYE